MIEYENLAISNDIYMSEMEEAASRVIRGGWYVLGNEVCSFEREFAQYLGAKHCVGVASGLDALILSIEALELDDNSEILVASNTYIATILAIVRAGHRPVLVEPELDSFNINPSMLEDALTPKTKAICVTHLFGKSCRMDVICDFARQNDLRIIEDCAQSHGAKLFGQMTGTFGDTGCFSFYPTKNLGAVGDAGAVVTDSDVLAERLRQLRNYGSKKKYVNDRIGINSRLDEIQAALLRVKLRYLDSITHHKRALADVYFDNLPDWIKLPRRCNDEYDVFHIFGVRHNRRDEVRSWLLEQGVKTEIHYPIPPHRQKAMKGIIYGNFPVAEELHATEISLPISPGTTKHEVWSACEILLSAQDKFGTTS